MSPEVQPTGLPLVDGLARIPEIVIADYVAAASEYVRAARQLAPQQKKASQIRLSAGLARVLLADLRHRIPIMGPGTSAAERNVSGALRPVQVDVSEVHPLDGLRLAVELKPVNLAVGRAIWNRFGDIRTTAVNIHLKVPFAIVGGVLTFPTYEEDDAGRSRSTVHLISRAVRRLERAGAVAPKQTRLICSRVSASLCTTL